MLVVRMHLIGYRELGVAHICSLVNQPNLISSFLFLFILLNCPQLNFSFTLNSRNPKPSLEIMSNPPADSLGEAAAARQLSLDDLEGEHRQLLVRAIARILSTELAKMTYAQVIDGLPTGDVAYDAIVAPHNGHPIDHAHDQLCPGMLEKAREFRDGFQPEILFFDSQVSLTQPSALRTHVRVPAPAMPG